jgi:endonuclease III
LGESIKRTGAIWKEQVRTREHIVQKVCDTLTRNYGNPRHGNPSDPLQDLLYVILSNKTAPRIARKTYARLRERFPRWEEILNEPTAKLRSVLKPAGLSHVKSKQIRAALRLIKQRFGRYDLRPLKKWLPTEAERFLVGLPGVSKKVAKCVMMYTLAMRVLPVDSHVHRVAVRLGWTNRKRADQCHEELEALVAPTLRSSFHVCCIAHGRKLCRPTKPLCHQCDIKRYCAFYQAAR